MRRLLASLATSVNALAGVGATAMLLEGASATVILPLLALSLAADGVDGALARRFGSIRAGAWLDALADLVSFVALPVALLAAGGHLVAAAAFGLAGAARLVRFIRRPAPGPHHFVGLPASVAAALVVLAAALDLGYATPLALVLAALMLAPLRYPALRGAHARLLAPFVLAILASASTFLLFPARRVVLLRAALVFVLAVLVGSPLLVREEVEPRARAVRPGADGTDVRSEL